MCAGRCGLPYRERHRAEFLWDRNREWGESDNEEEQEDDDEEDPELAEVSGKLKTLEMFEVDVDGNKRPWKSTRQGETKDSAKRWCVCAVLGRR